MFKCISYKNIILKWFVSFVFFLFFFCLSFQIYFFAYFIVSSEGLHFRFNYYCHRAALLAMVLLRIVTCRIVKLNADVTAFGVAWALHKLSSALLSATLSAYPLTFSPSHIYSNWMSLVLLLFRFHFSSHTILHSLSLYLCIHSFPFFF